jgi:hypothetical protein
MGPIKSGLRAVTVCLVVMLAGCKPKGSPTQIEAAQALATVLAEETAKAAGAKKQVLLIVPGGAWGSPAALEQEFKSALIKRGLSIAATKTADVGDPMRSGSLGLKGADFVSALNDAAVGAIVSFAGPPLLNPGDAVKPDHPPVLVVATAMLGNVAGLPGDRLQLARLLEAKVIQLAVVDATEPAPLTSGKSDAAHELFAQHYRILRGPE